MFVHPLTNPVVYPVNQRAVALWDGRMEMGMGLGCVECGGTCGGCGLGGLMDGITIGQIAFGALALYAVRRGWNESSRRKRFRARVLGR